MADIFELLGRFKPEPPTAREVEWMHRMDPVTLEIFSHRMQLTALEGNQVMVKTGATPAMSGTDINCALFTAQGDMAASASGVWIHAITGQPAIKYILKTFGQDPTLGIKDGDFFYITDPLFGATHTPDQICVMPVFHEGELIAWTSAAAHEADVGATEVGMPVNSRSRYDDGMKISPIKIGENFELRNDLLFMAGNMTRDPRSIILDIKARFAACNRMRRRVLEAAADYGMDMVIGGLRRLVQEGAEQSRRKLAQYNDGVYRAVVFMDTTGPADALRRVCATLTKKGDSLTIDLTGTSPMAPGPYNSYKSMALAGVASYLYSYAFYDVVPSIGIFEPFDFVVPDGALCNADLNASVNSGIIVAFPIMSAIGMCIAKMVFDSDDRHTISAYTPYSPTLPFFAGLNQWGQITSGAGLEINAAGGGGRYEQDGLDAMQPIWATLTDTEETEYFEQQFPFLYLYRDRIAMDNHGFGRYRGGAGLDCSWLVLPVTPYFIAGVVGFGTHFPVAPGIFGGYAGTTGCGIYAWNTDTLERMHQGRRLPACTLELLEERSIEGDYHFTSRSLPERLLRHHDLINTTQSGGGGYGDVLERDPELVLKDLQEGRLSRWVAENVYFVVLNAEDSRIDAAATATRRQEERERRKARAIPYAAFEQEWLKKRPPAEAMICFGAWEIKQE